MSRILLEHIPALTFYKDTLTSARRTSPIPQLVCVGKACDLYTPDAVRCTNVGGHGTEVDWKCEADLPESLRFGRVEVSCEGWSRAGDPYVLKGSCGLEYRLVQVPKVLRPGSTDDYFPRLPSRWFQPDTILSSIFATLWITFLIFLLYKILLSCLRPSTSRPSRESSYNPGSGHGGWFPRGSDHHDGSHGPPPPYSKQSPGPSWLPWQPGFWTGAALGSMGTYLFNRNNGRQPFVPPQPRTAGLWDWERTGTPSSIFRRSPVQVPSSGAQQDRGEGPSNLGAMRSSTGFGGSRVR